jgi:multidrug efflux pump subunit AcrA (membrane-fusion protein)
MLNFYRTSGIVFFFLSVACLASCNKNNNVLTMTLRSSDYEDAMDAPGTIQAVKTVNLIAPRVNVSGLTITYLAEDGAHVIKGDTVCVLGAPELNNMIESFTTEMEKMEAELKKLEADNAMEIAMLNAQVAINKSQLAITMLDSIQMKYAPDVKRRLMELEMEKANIEKQKLNKKLQAQRKINMSEVMQLRSRIMIQKSRIDTYTNQLKSLKLVAPCDGIAQHYEMPLMRFLSSSGAGTLGGKMEVGSNLFSNMTVLQIPDMSQMQVLIDVPEVDFKRIKEGQKVLIDVDAAASLRTTGKIKTKTLGGTPGREQSQVKIYQVIASVDSCHSRMKPGLSANCRIIVDHVADTVVIPAGAIFPKDSLKYVYVENGKKFIPVVVETGLANGSKCIITKGLKGNETIALIEPPHKLVIKAAKALSDTINNRGAGPAITLRTDSFPKTGNNGLIK